MLKYTALLTGSILSTSFTTVFLSGCSGPADDLTELYFFDPDEFELVTLMTDTILPRTDSPSATDVNVHHTIDSMIGLVFDEEFKTTLRNQWEELENYLAGQSFLQLDPPERVELLRNLEMNPDGEKGNARLGYIEIKQQAIAYYLSTEKIGEEYLNYLPIPAEYKPCITTEEVNNRAWAI